MSTPPSSTLHESDVRQVVRLLADVAVVEGGINDKKRRLVEGMLELVDADCYIWNLTRVEPGKEPVPVSVLHNLTEQGMAFYAQCNTNGQMDPVNRALIGLLGDHQHFSRRMRDLATTEQMQASGLVATVEQTDELSLESIFSLFHLPGESQLVSGIGIHRRPGKLPYTPRELKLIHILTSEIGWLHELGVPEEDGSSIIDLSPRLRSVLLLLIDGQSAKRIAYHLGLSDHTVRGYIKDLYRHLDVGSRPELMRRFMVGNGGDWP